MNVIKHEQTFTDLMSIGKAFAESGLFQDVKSAAQAVVKVQAGAELGLPPVASMTGIHLIQGKIVVGAGLLASRVKGSGKYDYRVTEHSDKVCSIDFIQGGEVIGTSTFTLEDAKKAGTKNLDKFPRNMLFARAMSNGVKWYTPDLFQTAVYVPGEIEEVGNHQPDIVIPYEPAPHEDPEQMALAVAESIKALNTCTDLQMLKDWKASTPDWLVKNPVVSGAAKDKFNQLKNK